MAAAEQDTRTSLAAVFGENVKYRRKWRGWTQKDLAARANLHPMVISQIERGKANPSLMAVETIARALRLDPPVLLDHARRKPARVTGPESGNRHGGPVRNNAPGPGTGETRGVVPGGRGTPRRADRPGATTIVRRSLIRALGRNVRGRRKRRKWHQAELARRAHLKVKTISEIERGATNARLSTVEAIALAFEVGPSELLNRLSAKGKTLAREEAVFVSEGWEDVDHGRTLAQALGANVRFHRTRQNLSQAALARLSHVRMGTISEIELAKSNPRVSTVESLAMALQVDPTFLVRRPAKDEAASIR